MCVSSFQNAVPLPALEPLQIEEDVPNRRVKSKKGKRVRFDVNGEIIDPTEAVQRYEPEPVSSSRSMLFSIHFP
jgi:hypothetical protein